MAGMTPHVEGGYLQPDGISFGGPLPYQWGPVTDDEHSIIILQAGRGVGKTSTLWERVEYKAHEYPGLNILWGAPSHKILIDGVFKLIRNWRRAIQRPRTETNNTWGFDPIARFCESQANMHLDFLSGSTITFRSTKDMNDFRGGEYGLVVFDEADYIAATPADWAAFAPTMRGYGPQLLYAAGTPSMLGSGLLAFLVDLAQVDTSAKVYKAHTLMNPYFPRARLRLMRATMGPDDWAREIEGKPVARSGLVYPEYDPQTHIIQWDPQVELRKADWGSWRTFVVIDWGYNKSHMTFLAARQGDTTRPPEVVVYRDIPMDRADPQWIAREALRYSRMDPIMPSAAICDPEGPIDIPSARPYFRQAAIPLVFEQNKAFRRIESTIVLVRRALRNQDGLASLRFAKSVADSPWNKHGGRGTLQGMVTYQLAEVGRGTGIYYDRPYDDNKTTHGLDNLRYFYINMGKFGYKWPWGTHEWSERRIIDTYRRAA
jgi:hypothetical protein